VSSSSSSSWPISRSSSTPDDPVGGTGPSARPDPLPDAELVGRYLAIARLFHPFPSALDAAVVAVVAAIAGAPTGRIALLAAAMLLLQFSIGVANDWADAPADATANPAKAIPRGLVRRRTAAGLAVVLAVGGLVLAAAAGLLTVAVACVGLAAGLAYDLRLKGTRWSWLPYTVGIPLLPVFAWVGATGRLPAAFFVLIPLAVVAGAALAVANALADLERDRTAGTETVATALGIDRAQRLGAGLIATAAIVAIGSAIALGGSPGWIIVAVAGAVIALAGVRRGWSGSARSRQRSWELQGLGAGLLAAGWVGAVADAGRLAG
jgi:4-hydroxybenzoate polyprenyltransferase